jgi:phosphoglucosamine mutase
MKVMPQVVVGARVSNDKKRDFDKEPVIKSAIAELDKEYDGRGRVLVRASGTEPLVRIMIEGEDLEKMTKEANELKELMEKHLGA